MSRVLAAVLLLLVATASCAHADRVSTSHKCPAQTSLQSEAVRGGFELKRLPGTYYELAYHDYTQPPSPYCGCQRSVKSLATTSSGSTFINDLFTLQCPAPPRKGKAYFNHLSFNTTGDRGVFHGHWPLVKSIVFPDAVIATGPVDASGGYSWVLEFQCVEWPITGDIAFIGINFYSRVISEAVFQDMLAAAQAAGLPSYWNGTIAGKADGTLVRVNHTGCTYPPASWDADRLQREAGMQPTVDRDGRLALTKPEEIAAAPSQEADAGDVMVIHALTNPDSPKGKQHCQQLTVPGGKASKFWAGEGWRYTSPPWTSGACPSYFNYVNRILHNLAGYTGVTWVELGVQTADEAPAAGNDEAFVDAGDVMVIHALTNPDSPKGKQHCQQLTVPGGKTSKFWAGEGWRYTSPPWTSGACPSYFNYVNRILHNLAGYTGVTWVELGVQTADQVEEAATPVSEATGSVSTENDEAFVDTGDVMVIHALTNPDSPKGKQHCQQLTVPGGKASKFWAGEGWRYTSPPWTSGACPSYFNYVNRILHNLAGYTGVTWVELGVQT